MITTIIMIIIVTETPVTGQEMRDQTRLKIVMVRGTRFPELRWSLRLAECWSRDTPCPGPVTTGLTMTREEEEVVESGVQGAEQ